MLALAFSHVHISVKDARKIPEKNMKKMYIFYWMGS
jgi:hypothetical protein